MSSRTCCFSFNTLLQNHNKHSFDNKNEKTFEKNTTRCVNLSLFWNFLLNCNWKFIFWMEFGRTNLKLHFKFCGFWEGSQLNFCWLLEEFWRLYKSLSTDLQTSPCFWNLQTLRNVFRNKATYWYNLKDYKKKHYGNLQKGHYRHQYLNNVYPC